MRHETSCDCDRCFEAYVESEAADVTAAENAWMRAAEYNGEAADEMHRQDAEGLS